MALTAEQWFPSVIWSGLLSGVDNNALETFAYDRKLTDDGVTVSNYLGWQSNSIKQMDNEEFDKFVEVLNTEIQNCAVQSGLPELQIQNIWININQPGAYNHLHNHAGAILSGVYYVKSDDDTNNIRVCIEETTSAINSCIRHKFAVSVEKRTTLPFYTNSFTQRTIEDITQGLQRPVLRRSVRIYHESDNKNANDYAYLGYES